MTGSAQIETAPSDSIGARHGLPHAAAGYATAMKNILIAVDLTEESRHAATVAREIFGPDATYIAINVADEPTARSAAAFGMPAWGSVFSYPDPMLTAGPDARHPVDQAEQLASHVATEAGVDGAVPVGAVGDPANAIVRAATEHRVDVIVVGSSERGWFGKLLDGSVAEDVVDAHAFPVLVVPQPVDAG